jgi:dCMP deaminase
MIKKIKKEDYYMKIAETVATKSNCLSTAIGCIIVKNDQIISTGYVGAPRKTMDCIELGYCIRRKNHVKSGTGYEMCRSVHAEMNSIINAARAGVSLLGGDMYLSTSKREGDGLLKVKSYPCLLCKKMIINAGINKFVGHDEKGKLKEYLIADWVKDWQDTDDITKDKDRYFTNYDKKK